MPIVGVVPAVKPAFERYPGGKILLLATPQTVDGEYLEELVSKYSGGTNLCRYENTLCNLVQRAYLFTKYLAKTDKFKWLVIYIIIISHHFT